MKRLSLTEAWNEASAFVRREGRLLYPIALLLNALPMAIAAAAIPEIREGQMPEPGLWLLLIPLAGLVGIVGSLAITFLALRPGRSVGEALKRGAGRFPAVFVVYLLIGLAFVAALILVSILAALLVPGLSAGAPPSPAAAGGLVLIMALVMVPLLLFVGTRLMLVIPVAAAEEGGPIVILKRAWALSGPVFWTLLAFLLLSSLLAAVINQVAQWVVSLPILLLAGPPRPGSISQFVLLLVTAAVGAAVTMFLTTMVARIYAQLAGEASPSGTMPKGI